ncbi:MAG: hypothetical protein J6D18_03550 [Erysipelotrichaceae bacterium]|nr:hypothetical protein [Erysipelotrichaceae bacterium]
MKDKIQINDLLDIYGGLLTRHQQEIMAYYYQEDYSYHEIAQECRISRAAVSDTVNRATKTLEKYEEAVGYLKKKNQIMDCLEKKEFDKIQELL